MTTSTSPRRGQVTEGFLRLHKPQLQVFLSRKNGRQFENHSPSTAETMTKKTAARMKLPQLSQILLVPLPALVISGQLSMVQGTSPRTQATSLFANYDPAGTDHPRFSFSQRNHSLALVSSMFITLRFSRRIMTIEPDGLTRATFTGSERHMAARDILMIHGPRPIH